MKGGKVKHPSPRGLLGQLQIEMIKQQSCCMSSFYCPHLPGQALPLAMIGFRQKAQLGRTGCQLANLCSHSVMPPPLMCLHTPKCVLSNRGSAATDAPQIWGLVWKTQGSVCYQKTSVSREPRFSSLDVIRRQFCLSTASSY